MPENTFNNRSRVFKVSPNYKNKSICKKANGLPVRIFSGVMQWSPLANQLAWRQRALRLAGPTNEWRWRRIQNVNKEACDGASR